jgi:succinate-semialdehyde dehydrogenase/glutarate-semialdehyde dehydrogenase
LLILPTHYGKNKTFEERAVFMKLAAILEENKEEYAQLATREMGKVIGQSQRNRKCAGIMPTILLAYSLMK